MRWTVVSEGQVRNGLKVIGEIPDYKICLLEGPNGIGKSVAVQLFELVSGAIPTALTAPAVWGLFKANLGNTIVNIEKMAGGGSARVVFTPERWPDEPPATVSDDFGTVIIDGEASTMSEIADLLQVTTIRGDESLQDTVRGHIQQVESQIYQTATAIRARANEVDEYVAQFSSDWLRADPDALAAQTALLEELDAELVEAQESLQRSDKTSRDLDRALELGRQLASADTDVEALLVRQAQLKEEVAQLGSTIAELEAKAEATEGELAAQGGSAAQLSQAQKTLRTRETRYATQVRELAQLAADNDLPADPTDVAGALQEARSEYAILAAEVDSIDRGRRVQDALGRLLPVLDATTVAASDDILMVIDKQRFTGKQVKIGLTARSKEISEKPQPEEVLATVAQLENVKRRITSLTAFQDAIAAAERTDALISDGVAALKAAESKAAGATKAAAALRDVHGQLAAAQAKLTAAHQLSVDMQEQIGLNGVASAKEAKAALSAILLELGVDEGDLNDAQAVAAGNLRAANDRAARTREAIAAARRTSDEVVGNIKALVSEVLNSESYGWLRNSLTPHQLSALADDGFATFAVIRATLLAAGETLFSVVGELERVARLAHVLAEAKPSKSDSAQLEQSLGAPMARALAESLREALNSPSIRTRVFGGQEVLRLDLQGQVIVLDAGGREERRAMSAFSTGERAFAFTQARIRDLPVSHKPNRLLVLDEFGAFISADRMDDLREFLEGLDDIAEQIVVILPLQVDYEAELEDTRGRLRERYQDRIAQLTSQRYSVVPL